jgi:hypothetical protein
MNVFINYDKEDLEIAKRLRNDLEKAGIKTWLEREDLLVGQDWRQVITDKLRESRYFITLLSSASVAKQGLIDTEPNWALNLLDNELSSKRISILPVRINDCLLADEKLERLHCADLFPSYEKGLDDILKVLLPNRSHDKRPISNDIQSKPNNENLFQHQIPNEPTDKPPAANQNWFKYVAIVLLAVVLMYHFAKPAPQKRTYHLRKEPITVSDDEALKTFKLTKDSNGWRRPAEYVENDFQDNKDGTITDRATGLMWQKSGSDNFMKFQYAEAYIDELNRKKFAGFGDWRLPTVDELTSLLTPEKQSQGLYISPLFDSTQSWCWTADKRTSGVGWHIYFLFGNVDWYNLNVNYFVRAVRSVQ